MKWSAEYTECLEGVGFEKQMRQIWTPSSSVLQIIYSNHDCLFSEEKHLQVVLGSTLLAPKFGTVLTMYSDETSTESCVWMMRGVNCWMYHRNVRAEMNVQ